MGDGADMMFKKYFEAQFAPLESGAAPLKTKAERAEQVEELDEGEEEEWSGFSSEEVEVVSYVDQNVRQRDEVEKLELRTFMVRTNRNINSNPAMANPFRIHSPPALPPYPIPPHNTPSRNPRTPKTP